MSFKTPLSKILATSHQTNDCTELGALLDSLHTSKTIYFPVRHHSPACSWHLAKLIRKVKPDTILIEGPRSFTSLIPLLLHPQTKTPVAIYTNYIHAPNEDTTKDSFGDPLRFTSYYPFCDYSPELQALRVGSEIGAQLKFIDLNYSEQLTFKLQALSQINPDSKSSEPKHSKPQVDSLLAEPYFKKSSFLQALAREVSCRDVNELWDHLFEARLCNLDTVNLDTVQFIREVAAYCHFVRFDTTQEPQVDDATLARERAMAQAIALQISTDTTSATTLVVTGGFHTVVLPALVCELLQQSKASADSFPLPTGKASEPKLIRYSFDRLDSLSGYAAGMPSPRYYDELWKNIISGIPNPEEQTAAELIVTLGQITRKEQLPIVISTADEIAALEHARRLAKLRNHTGPTRQDLLDAMSSCFVKGSLDIEGASVMELVEKTFSGAKIGDVPSEAGVPPLVEDFRARAKAFRLNLKTTQARKVSIDLYRNKTHRQMSRFFHSLNFLEVPYASMLAGPDFVLNTNMDRLFEHWDCRWIHHTETALIDASVYGESIIEATSGRLFATLNELAQTGQARSAAVATNLLISALRMGLHDSINRIVAILESTISADPAFTSLVATMHNLLLLWQSREPLEAHNLPKLPSLLKSAYKRACYLVCDLARCPEPELLQTLEALGSMREFFAVADEFLAPDYFWDQLDSLLRTRDLMPAIAGGCAGLLQSLGRMTQEDFTAKLSGYLSAASSDSDAKVAFLTGVLRTCREAAWQQQALLTALDSTLSSWSAEEFMQFLPSLRLAFAELTPRETSKVADKVAILHNEQSLKEPTNYESSRAQWLTNLKLTELVSESLKADNLETWLAEDFK